MKIKSVLIASALLSSLSGLSALLIPTKVLLIYGMEPSASICLMAQYSGLGSIAIGLISWFSRNIDDSQAKKTLVPALLIIHVIGTIISIMGTVSGTMKAGWPVVGLYFIFALGYTYFQFFKKD